MRFQAIVLSVVFAVSALAADATGTWKASQPGRKDGAVREVVYKLKADGDKLTGTMSGMGPEDVAITDGKVKGDDISFTVKREFNGNAMVMIYKGKVSGDEIKFSQTMEGRDQAREFTAKRAN